MKDDELLKIAGRPRLGWEDVIKKDIKKIGTS